MGKLIFLLIFSLALAVFASQNTSLVHIQFLMWKTQDVSLALIIILSSVLGAVIALIASLPLHHRTRRELKKHQRELEALRGQDI
jgi:uncharacterized integral membrane protein